MTRRVAPAIVAACDRCEAIISEYLKGHDKSIRDAVYGLVSDEEFIDAICDCRNLVRQACKTPSNT